MSVTGKQAARGRERLWLASSLSPEPEMMAAPMILSLPNLEWCLARISTSEASQLVRVLGKAGGGGGGGGGKGGVNSV